MSEISETKKNPPTEEEMYHVFPDYPCYGCLDTGKHCKQMECTEWHEWFKRTWKSECNRLTGKGEKS